jgi:hypothetical protein
VHGDPPNIANGVLYARDAISIWLVGRLFERGSAGREGEPINGVNVLTNRRKELMA